MMKTEDVADFIAFTLERPNDVYVESMNRNAAILLVLIEGGSLILNRHQ